MNTRITPPVESSLGALGETPLRALNTRQHPPGYFLQANVYGTNPQPVTGTGINFSIKIKSQLGVELIATGSWQEGYINQLITQRATNAWDAATGVEIGVTYGDEILLPYTAYNEDLHGNVIPIWSGTINGFCIYAAARGDGAPFAEYGSAPPDNFMGACLSLYLKGMKGLITTHAIDPGDTTKLMPALTSTPVDLLVDGQVDFSCPSLQAVIWWIGTNTPPVDPITMMPIAFKPAELNLFVARN